jgi:hypothetical protein
VNLSPGAPTYTGLRMTLLKILVVLGFTVVIALLVGLLLFEAPLEYGLDCNRSAGICTFSQRLLIRSKTGQARIDSLRQAEVRVGRVRRGSPRIMIWVTSNGAGPDWFFADYSSRAEAEADTSKINSFLQDPSDGRLLVTRSVKGIYLLAWILIPVVAGLIVALAALLFSRTRARSDREGKQGNQVRG